MKHCRVDFKISDNLCAFAIFAAKLQAAPPLVRSVRRWDLAHWYDIHERLANTNWYYLVENSLDYAAEWFGSQVVECMDELLPTQRRHFQNRGHAWITPSIVRLVKRKQSLVGNVAYRRVAEQCSKRIWQGCCGYARRTRIRLGRLKRGSKLWWSMAKRATNQCTNPPRIGPLCKDGIWALEDASKCNLLAEAFNDKYQLPPRVINEYTRLPDKPVQFYMPKAQPSLRAMW